MKVDDLFIALILAGNLIWLLPSFFRNHVIRSKKIFQELSSFQPFIAQQHISSLLSYRLSMLQVQELSYKSLSFIVYTSVCAVHATERFLNSEGCKKFPLLFFLSFMLKL